MQAPNLWQRIKHYFRGTPRAASFTDTSGSFYEAMTGQGYVSEAQALNLATVWRCVNLIAGDLGQLPLDLFQETASGREKFREHAMHRLFHGRPHPAMNPGVFKETMQARVLLRGNARARIVRDTIGRPIYLDPLALPPEYTRPVLTDSGHLVHVVREPGKEPKAYSDWDVFHLKGLGDGLEGDSVIAHARSSLQTMLAAETAVKKNLENSARPDIVLEYPKMLDKKKADDIVNRWSARHAGSENRGKPALIDNGMKVSTLEQMSPADAQWLESRQFSLIEIANWFGVPPHKLGASVATSYGSLEQENQAYLNSALMRWLVCWQEEANAKLLTDRERGQGMFFEFNTGALLRGDLFTRMQAYQIAVTSRLMTSNEVRRRENLNALEGGDVLHNPLIADPPKTTTEKKEPTDGSLPKASR